MTQPAGMDARVHHERAATAVDGIWAIRFLTRRGEQRSELMLSTTGTGLIGSLDGTAISDGQVADGLIRFGAELAAPAPTRVTCTASVHGDTMSGTAKASRLSLRFVGTWVAA